MKVSLFNLIKISIFILHSLQLFAKTKPIQGIVVSEANISLSGVDIISLPSITKTKSNADGVFYIDIPVDDRELVFKREGYQKDTIDAILFKNETKITMIKIVEVNYMDSVNANVNFLLERYGHNVNVFNKNDISKNGICLYDNVIYQENSIRSFDRINGERSFNIAGDDHRDYDILYNNIKIDYLAYPLMHLSAIGDQGVSELLITNGGYSKTKASLGSINYIPKINYDNAFSISQVKDMENDNCFDSYASFGIDIATINGGFSNRREIISIQDTLESNIETNTSSYFSNIGITNNKNFEFIVMGFQNEKNFYNSLIRDSLKLKTNNYLSKVEQWNPFTGKISVYGIYQDRACMNYNRLDTLVINDKASIVGFLLEKDINNYLFTFSTVTNLTKADWLIGGDALQVARSNSIFTGSTQVSFNRNNRKLYFKNIKAVYSKERTADGINKISNIDFEPNYWDNNSFWLSADIGYNKGIKNRLINFTFGQIHTMPNVESTIMGNRNIVPIQINDKNIIRPEYLSSMEFEALIKSKIEKYKWSYLLSISGFNRRYKDKIKHIPLLGSNTSFPINVGNANISGLDIHFMLEPYIHRFIFSSTISNYYSDDILKFQYIPLFSMKNEIAFESKIINIKFIINNYGKRYRTLLNDDLQLEYYKLDSFKNYIIHLSKHFSFKRFGLTLGVSGENINNEKVEVGGITINDRRIVFNIDAYLQ